MTPTAEPKPIYHISPSGPSLADLIALALTALKEVAVMVDYWNDQLIVVGEMCEKIKENPKNSVSDIEPD
jgi:hypothetical protein